MLYQVLKIIVKIALKVFFKSFKISHTEHLPPRGPMLVVANHPNTFMDPLIVASMLKPQVYFLANASIFNSPFTRWLFRHLHMIPIQRKNDTNKNKYDNREIFQKCFDFLGEGGTLLIFPEGTSIRSRRLQELKSGTARIALGAEAANDFSLGLKIALIGLNYSQPGSFRSEVYAKVEEPILVSSYKELYLQNENQAIQELTEEIRNRLEKHVVVTSDEEEDRMVKQIETVYKEKLSDQVQLSENEKEQNFLITQGIADAFKHFRSLEPQRLDQFRVKIQQYLNNLERLQLNDEVFQRKPGNRSLFRSGLTSLLYFTLGFPFFVYGLINNYLPYIIPSKVAAWVVGKSEVQEYEAPVMMISGIFTFTFFYILQILLLHLLFQNGWVTLIYALNLPLSGFFALFYSGYLRSTGNRWRLLSLFVKRTDLIAQLVAQRKEIIGELEEAKKDYLRFYEKSGG